MTKSFAALALLLAGTCVAQRPASGSAQAEITTYRLSFVVSYPGTQRPPQTIAVDVPVQLNHSGTAALQTTASVDGDTRTAV